jgi:hypothetical protein
MWRKKNEQKAETIDFSWLIELPEIHTLQIRINLTKKSNIDGIYKLPGLKELEYSDNYNRMPLDHNKLKTLEYLHLSYSKNLRLKNCSFDLLENLKSLRLRHIKDEINCIFIGKIKKLEYLEFSWSRSLKTLEGIENCKNIKSLSLRNLSQLENINSINRLEMLKGIWVENCKKINDEGKNIIIKKDEEFKEYRKKTGK